MADPVIAPPEFPLNGEREKNGEIALRLSLFHSKQPFSRIERCTRTSCERNLSFGQGAGSWKSTKKGERGERQSSWRPCNPVSRWGNKNRGGDGFSATFSWIQNFPLSFSSSLVESFPNYCEFIIKDLRKFKGKFSGERERNMLEKNGK